MNWKKKLKELEDQKLWDEAIEFMKEVIIEDPDNMEAYIFINFLIMNLLTEEEYDDERHDYYVLVLKKYYNESYEKFHTNAEYLFFTGHTGVMSPWFIDIDLPDADKMIEDALKIDPENDLYKFNYYWDRCIKDQSDQEMISYAKRILDPESSMQKNLKKMGAIGIYLFRIMKYCAKQMLGIEKFFPN